jgi:hypothetical protein
MEDRILLLVALQRLRELVESALGVVQDVVAIQLAKSRGRWAPNAPRRANGSSRTRHASPPKASCR